MLRSYCITALKQLFRHKQFSAINVIGLAVGMAACCLLLLYVQNETSWDRHWQHGERLYRVNTTFDLPAREPFRLTTGSALLLPALQQYFGKDIETAGRARSLNMELRNDNESLREAVVAVDPGVLDLFALEQLQGSLAATFQSKSNIALSENTALKLFGSTAVIGKTLTLEYREERTDYQITGVYRLPPKKTVIELPLMIMLDTTKNDFELQSWTRSPLATWIRLAPGVDVNVINARMNAFSDQYADISAARVGPDVKPSDILRYEAQRIDELHLDANFEDVTISGNRDTLDAFAVIAVLILLVACVNFTNLTTARASLLTVDVAMRKVVGASLQQLVVQFLVEALVILVLALLLALVLVELLLPIFSVFAGTELDFFTNTSQTYLSFALLLLLTLLISGLYPALLLARSQPGKNLKGKRQAEFGRTLTIRNALVVFQFGVAVALIIATGVIYLQVQFVSQRDPGFNGNNLIVIEELNSRATVSTNKQLLKQRILNVPGINSASLTGHRPLSDTTLARTSNAFTLDGEQGSNFIIPTVAIDENLVATYEIELLAGRVFSVERDQPAQVGQPGLKAEDLGLRTMLINASATRQLGFATVEAALGKVLRLPSQFPGVNLSFEIVGVLGDTQFYSLKAVPRPEVYLFLPAFGDVLTIRYTGATGSAMAQLSVVWKEVMGDADFTASPLDRYLDQEFASEKTERILLVIFALLAVFIACLGLYGSALFAVDKRTKEIGIRRVMGAEVSEIVGQLLWQFSRPVLLANLIAWPVALWVMLDWLARFPYRIDSLLLLPLCLLAGAIALSVAWLTVVSNTVRVASINPVHALRYE
jgi:putative ABC transport system permease protein